jgi:hypothetical protein
VFVTSTRDRVITLLAEGKSQAEIARLLGVVKSTVAYHARRVKEPDPRFRRRYDWAEVQRYYDEGHSITECQERFGFSRKTWHDARLRGDVVSRPHAMPLDVASPNGSTVRSDWSSITSTAMDMTTASRTLHCCVETATPAPTTGAAAACVD